MDSIEHIKENFQDEFWEDVLATPCDMLSLKLDSLKQELVTSQCDQVDSVQKKKGLIFESRALLDKVRVNINVLQNSISQVKESKKDFKVLVKDKKDILPKHKFLKVSKAESIVKSLKFRRLEDFKLIRNLFEKHGDHWTRLANVLYDKNFMNSAFKSLSALNLKIGLLDRENFDSLIKNFVKTLENVNKNGTADLWSKQIYLQYSLHLRENFKKANASQYTEEYVNSLLDQQLISYNFILIFIKEATQVLYKDVYGEELPDTLTLQINTPEANDDPGHDGQVQESASFVKELCIDKEISDSLLVSFTEQINFVFEKVVDDFNVVPQILLKKDLFLVINVDSKQQGLVDTCLKRYRLALFNCQQKCRVFRYSKQKDFYDFVIEGNFCIDDTKSSWILLSKGFSEATSNDNTADVQVQIRRGSPNTVNKAQLSTAIINLTSKLKLSLRKILGLVKFEYEKDLLKEKIFVGVLDNLYRNFVSNFQMIWEAIGYFRKFSGHLNKDEFEDLFNKWFIMLWG